MEISNKEAALLGILSEGDKHAYDINLAIESHSMDYWTEISTSSVYKLLRKLEGEEYLSSEIRINEKNVAQKVYSLTQKGRDAFLEKIQDLASAWRPTIDPIDIALKNFHLLGREEAIQCLEKYRLSLDETIKGYKDLEKFLTDENCRLANIQLAARRIQMLNGEKKWLENFTKEFINEGQEK